MDENLKKFKEFFRDDIKIKKELYNLAPEQKDLYDEESRIKYGDKLYDSLSYLEEKIKKISKDFKLNNEDNITELIEKSKEKITMCNYESSELNKIYVEMFSDMREEFVENVKSNFVGYTDFLNRKKVYGDVKTINEMLHAMHVDITNNEEIYMTLPKLDEKENVTKYPIKLYGEENEISRNIYENLPFELDTGYLDILGFDNKTIMMIRDRGHATTMEITSSDSEVKVEYFIPKICNLEMVKKLKGISNIKKRENGVRGIFFVEKDEISEEINDFISKIPMDIDMEILKGILDKKIDDNINTDKMEKQEMIVRKENLWDKIKSLINNRFIKNKIEEPKVENKNKIINENKRKNFVEGIKIELNEKGKEEKGKEEKANEKNIRKNENTKKTLNTFFK